MKHCELIKNDAISYLSDIIKFQPIDCGINANSIFGHSAELFGSSQIYKYKKAFKKLDQILFNSKKFSKCIFSETAWILQFYCEKSNKIITFNPLKSSYLTPSSFSDHNFCLCPSPRRRCEPDILVTAPNF